MWLSERRKSEQSGSSRCAPAPPRHSPVARRRHRIRTRKRRCLVHVPACRGWLPGRVVIPPGPGCAVHRRPVTSREPDEIGHRDHLPLLRLRRLRRAPRPPGQGVQGHTRAAGSTYQPRPLLRRPCPPEPPTRPSAQVSGAVRAPMRVATISARTAEAVRRRTMGRPLRRSTPSSSAHRSTCSSSWCERSFRVWWIRRGE